jgi:hypothetical protein
MAHIAYEQLFVPTDVFVDALETGQFALSLPTQQSGCTIILDRPKLEKLQRQIAAALEPAAPAARIQ